VCCWKRTTRVTVTTYDDATRAVLDYDQASAFNRCTIWQHYNVTGVLDRTVTTYDDGTIFVM
jgi:hypothetical protein